MSAFEMFGGYNYGEGNPEEFPSIEAAAREWRFRRDFGYHFKCSNGKLFPLWGDGIDNRQIAFICVDTGFSYNYNGKKLY